ncbi:MAG: efflux RND transporter periplasmic adaptor subunit [Syntrophomonadaceae bacterium]|nr:efflux RND transporter periplasmic adaptor subunit [Syntrophomonadaceae bacterium]
MKKKLLIAVGVLAIIGALYVGLNPPGEEVKTYQVQVGDIRQTINETGLVQASNYLDIYSSENGKVESIAVEIGSSVSKGDTILVLQNNDLSIQKATHKSSLIQAKNKLSLVKANWERVKLDYEEAKNNYARSEKLFKAGAISQSQLEEIKKVKDQLETTLREQSESYDQINEQVQILEKALQEIEVKERSLVITSPIDGTVVKLPAKVGQYLVTGTRVAQVASLNKLEIKTEVLSDDMADIVLGQKAIITAPLLKDKELEGEIVQIYPQAEERLSALGVIQYRVPVIISLKETDKLRPGYEVKVSIHTLTKEEVLIVPREAIIYDEDDSKQVMLIEQGRIKYVNVETGLQDRANIEITRGLDVGQKIILDGSSLLKEGTKVKEI